jgi:hypothetical protein
MNCWGPMGRMGAFSPRFSPRPLLRASFPPDRLDFALPCASPPSSRPIKHSSELAIPTRACSRANILQLLSFALSALSATPYPPFHRPCSAMGSNASLAATGSASPTGLEADAENHPFQLDNFLFQPSTSQPPSHLQFKEGFKLRGTVLDRGPCTVHVDSQRLPKAKLRSSRLIRSSG